MFEETVYAYETVDAEILGTGCVFVCLYCVCQAPLGLDLFPGSVSGFWFEQLVPLRLLFYTLSQGR